MSIFILAISKHAAKKDELLPEPVDFVDLVGLVKRSLEPIAEGKQVALCTSVGADVPITMADWEKLRRVMENLVNNAIKYTHRGGQVELSVAFDGVDIIIAVKDDGMGIAPEDIEEIFELYKQAGQSANRRYRGTGLGLVVVRNMVELHGGSVSVESQIKAGSTFTVRIPYVALDEGDDDEDPTC